MAKKARPVPKGSRTVTPFLVVHDATQAIEFYKKAFGGEEIRRSPGPGGKLMHAEVKIGDSIVCLSDEFPEMGGPSASPKTLGKATGSLYLYVKDADQVFQQAVDAGATVVMPLMDAFWGDRYGMVCDPFGHLWAIATHKQDLTPEEAEKAREAALAQMSSPQQ